MIVKEELEAALGAAKSQPVDAARRGYRHGSHERQLTTSLGPTTITMPRARLREKEGQESEWHSRIIRRYQRRTERVDGAILGLYLSGINTRRLGGALSPLLGGAAISRDAVSRLVGRIREELRPGRGVTWSRSRSLSLPGRLASAGTDRENAGASAGTADVARKR